MNQNSSSLRMNQNSSSAMNRPAKSVKFLYSYGGRIAPRPTDGKLRYVGGHTRVLSVDRSISFSEMMMKFGESCGSSVDLKCNLPSEDLDVLVTIKSDEDLRNVIQVYEAVSPATAGAKKIRAVLFPKATKKVSPPSSPISCFDFPSAAPKPYPAAAAVSCYASPPRAIALRGLPPAVGYPVVAGKQYRRHDPRHFLHQLQLLRPEVREK